MFVVNIRNVSGDYIRSRVRRRIVRRHQYSLCHLHPQVSRQSPEAHPPRGHEGWWVRSLLKIWGGNF